MNCWKKVIVKVIIILLEFGFTILTLKFTKANNAISYLGKRSSCISGHFGTSRINWMIMIRFGACVFMRTFHEFRSFCLHRSNFGSLLRLCGSIRDLLASAMDGVLDIGEVSAHDHRCPSDLPLLPLCLQPNRHFLAKQFTSLPDLSKSERTHI